MSQSALARAPRRRIKEIVLGKRAIFADMDLRPARYFGLGVDISRPCRRTMI